MKIFADSADVNALKKVEELGVLQGITTNPLIVSKEEGTPVEVITRLVKEFPEVPMILCQANGETCEEILEMAKAYAQIDSKLTIKIASIPEGFKALRRIKKERIFENKICITTITTVAEAVLAAAAGADYVSPYVGDIDQIGYCGMETLKAMVTALKDTGCTVLAAAVERAHDVQLAAEFGVKIVTITPQSIINLLEKPFPLTKWYVDLFVNAQKNKEK